MSMQNALQKNVISEAFDEAPLARIQAELDRMEAERGVQIVFAVESGSRAWGFASPDSDFDVRFVYKRGTREYARLDQPRDVIELPIADDLDINGWDLMKALAQFRKSNPSLLEWLHSPIIYGENGSLTAELRALARSHASPRRMAYHYLSMAKSNYRLSIENKAQVALKKYLYALRPLACVRWIELRNTPPPTSFQDTLAGITLPEAVRARLMDLMARKREQAEMGTEAHDLLLDGFIDSELERGAAIAASLPDRDMDTGALNALLWQELGI